MADLELEGGMQAIIEASTARQTDTIADSDLIQLYKEETVNGVTHNVPNIKVRKDVLMSCIQKSLASQLQSADKGTSIDKVPALKNNNGDWEFGSSGKSDFAEALGITKRFEFVDMGLPSGTLWASKNIGAETPEDYGMYFSWGNINGQKPSGGSFDPGFGTGNDTEPYVSSRGAELSEDIPLDYDAANRYLGGVAKMPTTSQFAELFNSSYTTNEWVTNYRNTGINGILVTSRANGNTLFFPAAGRGYGTSLSYAGSYGLYWSRSLVSGGTNGYLLNFYSSGVYPQNNNSRYIGFSVRAVL